MATKRFAVGMSGGVDSSAAACLLLEQGHNVIGVTMLTSDLSSAQDAGLVCRFLGIEHYVIDMRERFRKAVIEPFAREYLAGRTPNPCVSCNREVKWGFLLETADVLSAEFIATGHYSYTGYDAERNRQVLKRAAFKDQSYALCRLTQEQLARTVMPLYGLNKDEVRAIAKNAGLSVSDKPDSQEICFVPLGGSYGEIIAEYAKHMPVPGNFIDVNGNIIGEHKGIENYTIGQRKGLGAFGSRAFVKALNAADNTVTLAPDSLLYETHVTAADVNMVSLAGIPKPARFQAKIRYNHRAANCTAHIEDGRIICRFDEPQRAVTPGQALVLYDGDFVVCGGTIE